MGEIERAISIPSLMEVEAILPVIKANRGAMTLAMQILGWTLTARYLITVVGAATDVIAVLMAVAETVEEEAVVAIDGPITLR